MKKIERIIIYPLLFLALFQSFVGLKPTFAGSSEENVAVFDKIVAKEISIVNNEGDRVVEIGSEPSGSGGFIFVFGVNKDYSPACINIAAENNIAAIELYQSADFRDYADISIHATPEMNMFFLKYPKSNIFSMNFGSGNNENAFFNTFNTKGDNLVNISLTTDGDGAVFTYDKYGESYTSYGFDKYRNTDE